MIRITHRHCYLLILPKTYNAHKISTNHGHILKDMFWRTSSYDLEEKGSKLILTASCKKVKLPKQMKREIMIPCSNRSF